MYFSGLAYAAPPAALFLGSQRPIMAPTTWVYFDCVISSVLRTTLFPGGGFRAAHLGRVMRARYVVGRVIAGRRIAVGSLFLGRVNSGPVIWGGEWVGGGCASYGRGVLVRGRKFRDPRLGGRFSSIALQLGRGVNCGMSSRGAWLGARKIGGVYYCRRGSGLRS